MIFITADTYNLAIVFATGLNFNATVQLTENTCTGHPFFVSHDRSPCVFAITCFELIFYGVALRSSHHKQVNRPIRISSAVNRYQPSFEAPVGRGIQSISVMMNEIIEIGAVYISTYMVVSTTGVAIPVITSSKRHAQAR